MEEKIVNKKVSFWKRPVSVWEWIVAGVIFFLFFISFYYLDTISLQQYQIDFWKAMFSGRFFDFYQVSFEQVVEGSKYIQNTYGMFLNSILGIWGLPVYLISNMLGTDISGCIFVQLYAKLLFLAAFIVSAILVYKIIKKISNSDYTSKWAAFFYITSMMAMFAVAYYGQCDSIGLTFLLLGYYAYLCDKNITFVWFAMAIACKWFALFVIVPLILLKEKRILYIIRNCFIVILPSYIIDLPFQIVKSQGVSSKEWFSNFMLKKLLDYKIALNSTQVSLFLIFLGLVCVFCYLKKEVDLQVKIFIPLLTFIGVFLLFPTYHYWMMYVLPFVTIAVFCSINRKKEALVFEMIGYAFLVIYSFMATPQLYTEYYTGDGFIMKKILGSIFPFHKTFNLEAAASILNLDTYAVILSSVYIIAVITLLILAFPRKEKNLVLNDDFPYRPYLWVRLVINSIVMSFPLGVIALNYW